MPGMYAAQSYHISSTVMILSSIVLIDFPGRAEGTCHCVRCRLHYHLRHHQQDGPTASHSSHQLPMYKMLQMPSSSYIVICIHPVIYSWPPA